MRQVLLSRVREQSGRASEPSADIIITDTQEILLAVVILPARTSENHCGFVVLHRLDECYTKNG